MVKFSDEVRASIAAELKKVANFGSAGLTLLLGEKILNDEPFLVFLVIAVWWLAVQVLAHVILALGDRFKSG